MNDLRPKDGVIRVIPLGGVGEIGMNCCLIEYNGEIIMVDCGQMMPDEEMLGIDYVVADISYVLDRIDRFAGIVLTHAHEDHIGGLPYILPQLPENTPVYGSELTVALLKEKLREHRLSPNLKLFHARTRFAMGKSFMIEPLAVTHSMMDAYALAISTPIGTVIHTGDFKMDPCPMDGVGFDFLGFAKYADGDDGGILALLCDSTNADRPGNSPSESLVYPTLERLIREATGQTIMCTFASSLHRIQSVLNIAAEQNKIVFPAGLNMERNIRVAAAVKALEIPCRYEDNLDRLRDYPANRRLILTTGSQGEPLSALTRMALDTHKTVTIQPGDTVIHSARLIPGNEKAIYRMMNHLIRRGAKVYYPGNTTNIHASGHAYRDDIRHLLNLTNPRFLVPMHGEYRHMKANAELAMEAGMLEDEIQIIENGLCLEIGPNHMQVVGRVPHGRVFIDGKGIGDVEEVVIRDRRYLADDGVIIVILSVDRETGEVLGGPYLHSRGFASEEEDQEMMTEGAKVVLDAYLDIAAEAKEESAVVQQVVKKALKDFVKKKVRRFPVILPVIMEI
jgi:ribonuclease J